MKLKTVWLIYNVMKLKTVWLIYNVIKLKAGWLLVEFYCKIGKNIFSTIKINESSKHGIIVKL